MKIFVVAYEVDGATFTLDIAAADQAEAELKLDLILRSARIDGELVCRSNYPTASGTF